MKMDKSLWWNCYKVSIVILSVIINLTREVNSQVLFTDESNSIVNISQADLEKLVESLSANFTVNETPLLVEPVIMYNEEQNNTDKDENAKLWALYDSAVLNNLASLKDDRSQILNQIKSIDELIDSVVKDDNDTEIGSLSPRPKCTVTKEKLEKIQKEIQAIISNKTEAREGKSKCKLNFDSTDNCNSLLKTIQCGLDHVKNGLLDALANGGSAKNVAVWNNIFDELRKKFEKEKDDLKLTLTQKHEFELNDLRKRMQNLGKLFNDALERLEKNTIELCVKEIVLGIITQAVKHFNELKPTSITSILEKVYDFNENSSSDVIQRVDYIAQFIDRIGKGDHVEKFFKLLKKRNHLNDLRVLILKYLVSKINARLSDSNAKNEIEKNADKVLSVFEEVFCFSKKNAEFRRFLLLNSGKYFSFYRERIILSSLKRVINRPEQDRIALLKDMLDNVKTFPYFDQVYFGFKYIKQYIQAVKNYDGHDMLVMRLIYHTNYFKDKLLTTNNKQQMKELNIEFDRILKDLPQNVVKFITKIQNGNTCKIINAMNSNYLYAYQKVDGNGKRRFVYFLKPEQTVYTQGWYKWKIETSDNCESFTIKNVQYDGYLYPTEDDATFKLIQGKSIYIGLPKEPVGPEGRWKITLVPSKSYQINLKNIHRNAYIYQGPWNFYYNFGPVYTWNKNELPPDNNWQNFVWDFEC